MTQSPTEGDKEAPPVAPDRAEGWLRRIVDAPSALFALFCFSFLEATMLPVPVEAVMAPYMQMRRDILWRIAGVALAGFMASALLGYGLGSLFFDTIGAPLVERMGWGDRLADVQGLIEGRGFWAMLVIGITPVPTQLAMISAGSLQIPVAAFIGAMLIARGLRYFGMGLLVYLYGDRVVRWVTPRKATGHGSADP